MKKKTALQIILGISIAGILFSGYLSINEIFATSAHFCDTSNAGVCTSLFEIPSCVYGFVMYAAVLVVTILGLKSKK